MEAHGTGAPRLKRGFYSGPETNPAGRMVGTVGRPDNHNLTGRFNEPYATYSTHLPSDGHLIIRDTRTLDHLPPPNVRLVRFPFPEFCTGWNRWLVSSSFHVRHPPPPSRSNN